MQVPTTSSVYQYRRFTAKNLCVDRFASVNFSLLMIRSIVGNTRWSERKFIQSADLKWALKLKLNSIRYHSIIEFCTCSSRLLLLFYIFRVLCVLFTLSDKVYPKGGWRNSTLCVHALCVLPVLCIFGINSVNSTWGTLCLFWAPNNLDLQDLSFSVPTLPDVWESPSRTVRARP